jgi:hypothetical protein
VLHALNQQIDRDLRQGKARAAWHGGNELPPRTDGWERCGNVYWLAYDTLVTALSLVTGDTNSSIEGAIHHAEQLPLVPIHAAKLRQIQSIMADPQRRSEAANALILLAQELGRTIQEKQPDFDQRDPWTHGKQVYKPIF